MQTYRDTVFFKDGPMIEKMKKSLAKGDFNIKGVIAFVLFGAIVLVFVFFGLPTQNSGVGAAAEVNNSLISLAELQRESTRMEQMYGQLMSSMGGAAQRQFIRTQALETLINGELLAQSAEESSILSTDAEVRDILINDIPAFKRDGYFMRDQYLAVLEANNLSPSEFESQIRKDRMAQRARKLFELSEVPLDVEVKKIQQLKSEKRKLDYIKFSKEGFLASHAPLQAQVDQSLANPEFMKRVSDYYAANSSEFQTEESVKARHILVKFQPGNAESETQALQKIKDIRKTLTPENFASVAQSQSEDEGSKAAGGDLGFFGRGRMVPEFESAAFSQEVGVVGAPVKSNFGYHLLLVEAKKPIQTLSLDEAKAQIAKKLLAEETYERFLAQIEEALKNQDMQSVNALLADNRLKWQSTNEFTADSANLPELSSPSALQAALELKEKGQVLNRVIREGSDKIIIRLASLTKDTSVQPESLRAEVGSLRAMEMMNLWLEDKKKSARIKRNQQILLQ